MISSVEERAKHEYKKERSSQLKTQLSGRGMGSSHAALSASSRAPQAVFLSARCSYATGRVFLVSSRLGSFQSSELQSDESHLSLPSVPPPGPT
ncbi:hypothetical protein R1flu_025032 [Riccia fluitans]|uniref:Uncharacterized protein n=1 Tax=Riccia fluitans TaxID=41844 RepID=A0ABD1XWL4_9MARC